jgi:hypothetical protein
MEKRQRDGDKDNRQTERWRDIQIIQKESYGDWETYRQTARLVRAFTVSAIPFKTELGVLILKLADQPHWFIVISTTSKFVFLWKKNRDALTIKLFTAVINSVLQ